MLNDIVSIIILSEYMDLVYGVEVSWRVCPREFSTEILTAKDDIRTLPVEYERGSRGVE